MQVKMKLLIDIGNTNSSLAVASGKRIVRRWFISSSKEQVEEKPLGRLLRPYIKDIDTVLIVSVVPKFLTVVKDSLKKVLPEASIKVVGKNIKVPIRNKYSKPRQVGQDRLVAAYSAYIQSGGPILVIDFGTAVTFDLVNGRGEYEGGLIFPGIRLGLSSLSDNAALLPKVEIGPQKGFIGKNTRGSINKGIIHGYASLCDGMIRKFRDKYGDTLKVVATGGDAALIARYSNNLNVVSKDLIFKGLNAIASR